MATVFDFLENSIKRNASLDRAFLLIEYGDWEKAAVLLEDILNENPRNSIAYLGKVMIAENASKIEDLTNICEATKNSPDYQLMIRFADDDVKAVLNAVEEKKLEQEKEKETQKQRIIQEADRLALSTKENDLKEAISLYNSLDRWGDSGEKAQKTEKQLQDFETVYTRMVDWFNVSATAEDYLEVVKYLQQIGEYKHAKQLAAEAEKRAKAYKEQEIIKRADMLLQRGDLASLREAENIYASIAGQEAKLTECQRRIEEYCTMQYSEALRLMAEEKEDSYTQAIQILKGIPEWRDSKDLIDKCDEGIEEKRRIEGVRKKENRLGAEESARKVSDVEEVLTERTIDSSENEVVQEGNRHPSKRNEAKKRKVLISVILSLLLLVGSAVYIFATPMDTYLKAKISAGQGNYEEAIPLFESLGDYRDSQEQGRMAVYEYGIQLFGAERFEEAAEQFKSLGDYRDSHEQWGLVLYDYGLKLIEEEKFEEALTQFKKIGQLRDCSEEIEVCKRNSSILSAREYLQKEDYRYAIRAIGDYEDVEFHQMMADHLVIYLEKIERGENLELREKKDIGWALLNTIEWNEIKTIIKAHPAASFSLIVYEDNSYADVALYYIKQGENALPEDIIFDVEFMKIWAGEWVSSVRDGGIEKEIRYEFQLNNDEVLVKVTSGRGQYKLQRHEITNIYYLFLTPENEQDEPVRVENSGNEMILRFKYSFGSRPIRFQRKDVIVMKDPAEIAQEMSIW